MVLQLFYILLPSNSSDFLTNKFSLFLCSILFLNPHGVLNGLQLTFVDIGLFGVSGEISLFIDPLHG